MGAFSTDRIEGRDVNVESVGVALTTGKVVQVLDVSVMAELEWMLKILAEIDDLRVDSIADVTSGGGAW